MQARLLIILPCSSPCTFHSQPSRLEHSSDNPKLGHLFCEIFRYVVTSHDKWKRSDTVLYICSQKIRLLSYNYNACKLTTQCLRRYATVVRPKQKSYHLIQSSYTELHCQTLHLRLLRKMPWSFIRTTTDVLIQNLFPLTSFLENLLSSAKGSNIIRSESCVGSVIFCDEIYRDNAFTDGCFNQNIQKKGNKDFAAKHLSRGIFICAFCTAYALERTEGFLYVF